MRKHWWRVDPIGRAQALEAARPGPGAEAGALVFWATLNVDGLHHLRDVDKLIQRTPQYFHPITGHTPWVVDLAHARWAVGTAITALDLCAAALGRMFLRPHRHGHEYDVGDIQKAANRNALPAAAASWLAVLERDPAFAILLGVRHKLTHAHLPRDLSDDRTAFQAGYLPRLPRQVSKAVKVTTIINMATRLATRHVERFLAAIPF